MSLNSKERRELIMMYLLENYGYNDFEADYKKISEDIRESYKNTKNSIDVLLSSGSIQRVSTPKRGTKPILRVTPGITATQEYAQLSLIEDSPQLDIVSKQGDEVQIFNFQGKKTRILYGKQYGYVIAIPDFAEAIGINQSTLYQYLKRNEKVFDSLIVEIPARPGSKQKTMALTRQGVVLYLQKTDGVNAKPEVKQKIIEFQRWASIKLDALIVEGKVELKDQEHQEVLNLFKDVTGLNDEGMQKIVAQIQGDILKLANYVKRTTTENGQEIIAKLEIEIAEKEKQIKELERNITYLQGRRNYLTSRMLELESQILRIRSSAR